MQPIDIGCLTIHRTRVTATKSTKNNIAGFFLDNTIVYYNNNLFLIPVPWTREGKYFTPLLIWRQYHSKSCKQNFVGSLT